MAASAPDAAEDAAEDAAAPAPESLPAQPEGAPDAATQPGSMQADAASQPADASSAPSSEPGMPEFKVIPVPVPQAAQTDQAPKDPTLDDGVAGVWAPSLFGDPVPLSRRPPTNRMLTLEADLRYALVGTGPTRFVTDFRFSPLPWVELRTQMGPVVLPESLMARVSVGPWRTLGRVGVEAGFNKLDFGLRLFPEAGQDRGFNPDIVPSLNTVGALTYDVPIWTRFALHFSARTQQRLEQSVQGVRNLKFTNPLSQFSYQLAAQGVFDVTPAMGLTVGVAWGQALYNTMLWGIATRAVGGTVPWQDEALPRINLEKARKRADPFAVIDTQGQCRAQNTATIFIDYVESARPGYSTLVDRDNNCSLSVNGALTYGRTEAFDVDLFGALRMWPSVGGLFGAGIRWRVAP